jgi:hypothetical protein
MPGGSAPASCHTRYVRARECTCSPSTIAEALPGAPSRLVTGAAHPAIGLGRGERDNTQRAA